MIRVIFLNIDGAWFPAAAPKTEREHNNLMHALAQILPAEDIRVLSVKPGWQCDRLKKLLDAQSPGVV